MKYSLFTSFAAIVVFPFTLMSCTVEGGTTPTGATDGDVILEAALGTMNSALDEVDGTLGDTINQASVPCSHTYICSGVNAYLERDFNSCAYKIDDLASRAKVTGTSKITFADQAACLAQMTDAATTAGTTIQKTYSNFVVTDSGRSQTFAVASVDPIVSIYVSNRWTVTVPEVTRVSTKYNYTVSTPAGASLSFTGSRKAGTRSLSAGSIRLLDKSDKTSLVTYTMALAAIPLKWESKTCCLPTEGVIMVTNNLNDDTLTYTFDGKTCNQFTKTDASGKNSTVTVYNACE